MSKKWIAVLISACIMVTCCTAACVNLPAEAETPVHVYVIGGEGSGVYLEGTNCRLVAEIPEGKQFMYWEADGVRISAAEEFVFTVSEDVTVFAVYADEVENVGKNVFTVNVPALQEAGVINRPNVSALGAGGYLEGASCTLSLRAIDMERTFTGWAQVKEDGTVGEIVSYEKSYTFTVTENVTLMPVFPYSFIKLNTPGKDTFKINGGTLEFDRNSGGTLFTDKGNTTKYIKFRVYDNENAEGESLGEFNLEHKWDPLPEDYEVGSWEFNWFRSDVTLNDGTLLFIAMAEAGNIYYPFGGKDMVKGFLSKVVENFDDNTTYYFRAQLCGPAEPCNVNGVMCEVISSEWSEVCSAQFKYV